MLNFLSLCRNIQLNIMLTASLYAETGTTHPAEHHIKRPFMQRWDQGIQLNIKLNFLSLCTWLGSPGIWKQSTGNAPMVLLYRLRLRSVQPSSCVWWVLCSFTLNVMLKKCTQMSATLGMEPMHSKGDLSAVTTRQQTLHSNYMFTGTVDEIISIDSDWNMSII